MNVLGCLLLLLLSLQSFVIGEPEFDPYNDNKGTIVGIAGEDFIVIAADTRLPDGFLIRSRSITRLFELGDLTADTGSSPFVLASAGCWSDTVGLQKALDGDLRRFHWENKAPMSINALAHLLSSTLFSRRTFPYYTFNAVAGFDRDGRGAIYRYDAIGSFERVSSVCVGNGEALLQPMLDDALEGKGASSRSGQEEKAPQLWILSDDGEHFSAPQSGMKEDGLTVSMSQEMAVDLIIEVFKAAAEREISIGDGVDLWILSKPVPAKKQKAGRRPPTIAKRSFSLPSH